MKRHFSNQKIYNINLLPLFRLVDLQRFCGLMLAFTLSEMLSVSIGNISDISEWLVILDDGLLIENIGLSLLGVLLINPILIEQIWRVFYFLAKALCSLYINTFNVVFLTPSPHCIEHSAHGCRAPPTSL